MAEKMTRREWVRAQIAVLLENEIERMNPFDTAMKIRVLSGTLLARSSDEQIEFWLIDLMHANVEDP